MYLLDTNICIFLKNGKPPQVLENLKDRGVLIGAFDLLIASQALAKKLILVSNNTAEFEQIDGLQLEDWK